MVLTTPGGSRYRRELSDLRQQLLEMGGSAEECLSAAIDVLMEGEAERLERARALEAEINDAEKAIDERCMRLLAVHQPAASELRFVAMAMKLATDLERIGDLAMNIARRARLADGQGPYRVPAEVPRMTRVVREMIGSALDAFVELSAERANAVLVRDDVVDELHWQAYRGLEERVQRAPESAPWAMRMVLVIKDLERAADHATNIAEGVIYMVRGRDVRHGE